MADKVTRRPAPLKPETSDRSGEKGKAKPPVYGIRPDLHKPTVREWPSRTK